MSVPVTRRDTAWIRLAIVLSASLTLSQAYAQQLEPRAYSDIPVGLNFLLAGYTYSSGGIETDPALPLENAKLHVRAPFVGYAHAFDAWGNSAKFDAVLAGGCLSGTAESNGVPVSRDVCGMLDPAFRVTVNFYGAPALSLEEFRNYRQDLIIGASLQVSAPLGQYDPSRLVNLGTNRWMLRPELGASKKFGSLTMETAFGASLFTTNDDFFGGKKREQAPITYVQMHLIYEFSPGSWLALNGNYYTGGRTTVDDVQQNDELGNSRVGATLALPVDRTNSIKLHASKGVSIRFGEDFQTIGAAWQHRWGAGL